MKIPENPYYGNEDSTQWQPNGVIIDSGVGGGVVGSGDAGARPVYPVHIPRHIPAGYVMPGAYYPPYAAPAPVPDDFEDYMWMENEEEFDKQVMQQLEEEALMEQCIEAMLEDEQRERTRGVSNGHCATTSTGSCNLSLEETVSRSTLNPLAAEFVPSRVTQTHTHTEEMQENIEVRTEVKPEMESEEVEAAAETTSREPDVIHHEQQEIQNPPPQNPPETDDKDKKTDVKKTKPEVKAKTKPQSKSDTKVAIKKSVKTESRTEEKVADVKPATEETGFKPINYAAAAKANKPKKPETEKPKTDKPAEKPKTDKPAKPLKEKPKIKTEKPIQRKNSMK